VTTTVTDCQTKRVDELKPGDWITNYPGSHALGHAEIVSVYPYTNSVGNDRVLITFLETGYPEPQTDRPHPEELVKLVTAGQLARARELAEREQKLVDIESWIAWMRAHPDAPMDSYPRFQINLHGADAIAEVRRWADLCGQKLDESLDDRTAAPIRFGSFEWDLIAWHRDGRPAADVDDPTGLLYQRDADDPTPVSPARGLHVGAVVDDSGAPVEETPSEPVVRYFSFGHGHRDPATGEPLIDKYVTVVGPDAEACRTAMLASRFGRNWSFEYIPGTPRADEWIPRWTEHECIDATDTACEAL